MASDVYLLNTNNMVGESNNQSISEIDISDMRNVMMYITFCFTLLLSIIVNIIRDSNLATTLSEKCITLTYHNDNIESHSTLCRGEKGNQTQTNINILRNENTYVMLNELRVKNMHRIIIGHININSLRYKFNDFDILSNKNLDIILISETKLDASFASKQFVLDGYSLPFRLDRSNTGGGLLLFIKEGIPTKLLSTNFTREGIFMEINLKKKKMVIFWGL